MINIVRTNQEDRDFTGLVRLLDAELANVDGDDHAFYSQFNKIDRIRYVVVAYEDNLPVGCGAIKEFDRETTEVKRMYVATGCRNKGIATRILLNLKAGRANYLIRSVYLRRGRGSRMQSGSTKRTAMN